jgi:ElaB/YqjD/DUF883 family membrane-anchored ribosome-binding protein
MSSEDEATGEEASAKLAAAVSQAEQAINAVKDYLSTADLDALRSRAANTATNFYQGGREFLSKNDDLAKAQETLAATVRKNPLAAVGVAFTAGLVLALLTRG